jgi:type III pantothenate kinase
MIVLIDAGNTLVKFGWLDPRTRQRESRPLALAHHDLRPLDDWLDRLPQRPTAAIGINVANPGVTPQLEVTLGRHACPVRWVTSLEPAPGLLNGYDPASQLGADRWVALAGLARHAGRDANVAPHEPLMLATFGTATTIDTLGPAANGTAPRKFHGGMIFPGPAMMRTALAVGTAQLPDADGTLADYPTHTRQAIATGIAAAQAGAVVRQWLVGLDTFGQAPRMYSAGGGWATVEHEVRRMVSRIQRQAGAVELGIEWLPTPVLSGLATLARTTRQPSTGNPPTPR